MKTSYLKILFFFSLILIGLSGASFAQTAIPTFPDSLLIGFDEETALLELKESTVDPDMIARFLYHKKREFIETKAGIWNVPIMQQQAFLKNGGGNNSIQAAGCNNSDFELGNFTGWDAASGSCPSYFSNACLPAANPICPVPGLINGRHTIMSGIGFDPWVGPALPVVSSGGSYSVRIGNEEVGGEAEQLSTTFTVTQSHFSYKYAVVLNDPSHSISQQPFFKIDVIETATGNPVTCAQYFVVAGAGVPGFQSLKVSFRTIRWKPWSTVTMDLSAYMNQQVTIRFTTADCGAGGHFGYAYIDCFCEDLKVTQQDTVCQGTDASLAAPDNFATYSWSPVPSTDQILITKLPTTYTVTMTSFSGCVTKAYHTLETFPVPSADFSYEANEDEYTVQFTDLSTIAAPGSIIGWSWEFGDGAIDSIQNPAHLYAEGGEYNVRLTVTSDDSCTNSVEQQISVGAYTFYTPNAFTPNGDNLNDAFEPKGRGITKYRLLIYDRWGNIVFETYSLDDKWNGNRQFSNKLSPIDVYVWKAYLTDIFANEYERTGHVALIK